MSFNRAASSDAVPRIASSYPYFLRQQSDPISGYLYLSNERAPCPSGDGVQSKWSIDDMVLYVSVASIFLESLSMLCSVIPRQTSFRFVVLC
jgi:hypothetical protein